MNLLKFWKNWRFGLSFSFCHQELANVHNVFHASIWYVYCLSHVLNYEPPEIQENLTYEEIPEKELKNKIQELQTSKVLLVKILWKNHAIGKSIIKSKRRIEIKVPTIF